MPCPPGARAGSARPEDGAKGAEDEAEVLSDPAQASPKSEPVLPSTGKHLGM